MRGTLTISLLLGSLLAAPAAADSVEDRFGSDAGNSRTFWELLKRTVHLEAAVGIYFANLSGGLTALTALMDDSGSNAAVQSIGRGSGQLREVRFGLEVAGNEAFFDYLSDELFAAAEEEVRDRVGNRLAEEAILLLIGELRPDLTALLGEDAKVWVRAWYGRFKGEIDEPWRFSTRYGEPWFGHEGAGWETEFFSVEAGVFPDGRGKLDEFQRRQRRAKAPLSSAGDEGAGLYLRYTRFDRPVVLGFGVGTTGTGYILEDAGLQTWELGVRWELLRCKTVCWRASGTFAPFTAWSSLDLGRFGSSRGLTIAGGGEVKLSYPINLFSQLFVSPYLSFRADFLFPLLYGGDPTSIDEVQVWNPDYLLWGPTIGIAGRF